MPLTGPALTPQDLAATIAQDPAAWGLVLDFDGTLAPIVDDPATSALPEGLDRIVGRLARRLGGVAVVSGRPVTFLAERARIDGVRLLGLYGTQEWRDGRAVARPEALEWEPALDTARDRIALALAGHRGIVLEDKGLAVAVHWRNAPDQDAAGAFVNALVDEVAADTGLATEPGKLVNELRPPLGWDKGSTVTALVRELALQRVVYAGDDRGDLPALAAARRAGGVALVVDHGDETADEVRAAGDVVVDGTTEFARWLGDLAARLGPVGS